MTIIVPPMASQGDFSFLEGGGGGGGGGGVVYILYTDD